MSSRRRRTRIAEQFAARVITMLTSPAMAALSLSARRVLDRLEVELANHAGTENGKLPCTFRDFEVFGIDKEAIAPAIREVIALGFVERTEQGRGGNREFRRPNLFRLTYKPTDYERETDEWRRVKTKEQAIALARTARQQKSKTAPAKPSVSPRKHRGEKLNSPPR